MNCPRKHLCTILDILRHNDLYNLLSIRLYMCLDNHFYKNHNNYQSNLLYSRLNILLHNW